VSDPARLALEVLTACGVAVVCVQPVGTRIAARVHPTRNRQAIARARRLLARRRIALDVSILRPRQPQE